MLALAQGTADVSVSMRVSPSTAKVGDTVLFSITLRNNGPNTATDVTLIVDPLPPGVTLLGGLGCFAPGCNFGTIGHSQEIDLFVETQMRVQPNAAGTLRLYAQVTANEFDPNVTNNLASATTQVRPLTADVTVSMRVSPATAKVGDIVVFTISIRNNGPDAASDVTLVTSPLPPGATLVEGERCSSPGCNFGQIGHSDEIELGVDLQLKVQLNTPGTLRIYSLVKANEFDPNTTNNLASATMQASPLASDLSLTITPSTFTAKPGDTMHYGITATGNGPDGATGVSLGVSVSPSVGAVIDSIGLPGCSIFSTIAVCPFPNLPRSQSIVVGLHINFTAPGAFTIETYVSADQGDPNSTNNRAIAALTVKNSPPVSRAGPDQKIATTGAPVLITLDGSATTDPDGNPLTFEWRDARSVIGTTPVVQVTRGPGSYTFRLTAKDAYGSSASDSVSVLVVADTTPPIVAVQDIAVGFTESGGVRGKASSRLHDYLAGINTSAVDDVDPRPAFVEVAVNGVRADDDTLFPEGDTKVTVTYRDQAGNRGAAEATITVVDRQDNDVFVFGPGTGANAVIYRVRGSTVEEFCTTTQYMPFADGAPVIMDSRGRVVFLGYMGFFGGYPVGLFRCTRRGDLAEGIAEFKTGPSGPQAGPDLAEAFPGIAFNRVGSLHLAGVRSIVIDDNVNNGSPQVITEDAYALAERPASLNTVQTVRYRTKAGVWEGPGQTLPDPIQRGSNCCGNEALPSMVSHGGSTYSSDGATIRRTIDPLRVDVSSNVNGSHVRTVLSLFGGTKEIPGGTIVNDQTIAHVDSGCPPPAPFGVSDQMPVFPPGFYGAPGLHVLELSAGLFYDEYTGKGLLAVDTGVPGPGAIASIGQERIDDNPLNDNVGLFRNSGCAVVNSVLTSTVLPYFDPATGVPNDAPPLASAPNGIYATFGRSPIRIGKVQSQKLISVATLPVPGLSGGIAAFPAATPPPLGKEIIIRVDSPVDVLATDPNGKRIGILNGQPVNDFGGNGFDSGPDTHPRFFAIRNAAAGDFLLRSVGTGAGPFAVHVYSIDLDKKYGQHVLSSGNASPGTTGKHDFTISAEGTVSFTNRVPTANAGVDQTLTAAANGAATVSLDGSRSFDPDGDPLTWTWAGPFGVINGALPQVVLTVGVHVLSLTVDDSKGGSGSSNVAITVNAPSDMTPPVLRLPASFTVVATSPAGAAPRYSASALDDVDGVITPSCAPASDSNFPIGTTTVNCTATDAAGNTARGSFNVTVSVGTLRISGTIAATGTDPSGARWYDLRLTNAGTGLALNVQISGIALRVLAGSGLVTVNAALSPLPIQITSLDIGSSVTVRLFLNVPEGVTRFSITENGGVKDVLGTSYKFSLAQAVSR